MIPVVALASGIGGRYPGAEYGPKILHEKWTSDIEWQDYIVPGNQYDDLKAEIERINQKLAQSVCKCVSENPFTIVLGGDHSCGMGTWSGASVALAKKNQELGLIWIDAHMDCHTLDTSHSGFIHGMPVASLIGLGHPPFKSILSPHQKINPKNVFIIGARSYEQEEVEHVENLGVQFFSIEEVQNRGLSSILKEAVSTFVEKKIPYGISLDVDFFSPESMPATNTPVENGVDPEQFLDSCKIFERYPPLVFEYVEFNPQKDIDHVTLTKSIQILDRVVDAYKVSREELVGV